MAADDPRHAWSAENQVAIQARAQAEASKKTEVLSKAKEYLEKVNKVGFELLVGSVCWNVLNLPLGQVPGVVALSCSLLQLLWHAATSALCSCGH
jgi:hypothetical protein